MHNFLFKRKFLFCLILSLILIGIVVYINVINREYHRISQTNIENADEPLVYDCCAPLNSSLRTKLFFLKIHKTASTTVQNVILRFALRHSLDVMSTNYVTYFLPLTDLSIYPPSITPNNKYHIWAHHLRYDYERLKSYQYPDTMMVTLLRHPANLFQSLYEFYRFNDSSGMTFPQFLNAPTKPTSFFTSTSLIAYRGYNQMSYDLGFDSIKNADNQIAINEFIKKIDREFNFVMITEYFEASLVLLANLMGWPLEYVAHLKLNARPRDPNHYTMTNRDKEILIELNQVDAQLYLHFLQKFLKCVRQYGQEKMNQDVDRLRMLNERFKERCVAEEKLGGLLDGFLQVVEYVPRNASDLECKYAISDEVILETIVVAEQSRRVQPEICIFGKPFCLPLIYPYP